MQFVTILPHATCQFPCSSSGKHYIDVFWNGFALPSSPYQGYASPATDEPDAPIQLIRHVRATPNNTK